MHLNFLYGKVKAFVLGHFSPFPGPSPSSLLLAFLSSAQIEKDDVFQSSPEAITQTLFPAS